MNDLISAAYSERLRRVCDHIERHLDEPLSLEALSRMAHSSPFHFHRQFTVWSGLPLYRYIQWLRLRNGPVADCQQSNFWYCLARPADDAAGSIPL